MQPHEVALSQVKPSSCCVVGEGAVDVYMRILMAIDSEVVDRDIAHTDVEFQRNSLLKDNMRVECIPQLVDSWYHIIVSNVDSL